MKHIMEQTLNLIFLRLAERITIFDFVITDLVGIINRVDYEAYNGANLT